MSYKLLKQAADQLDKLASELEASEKALAQATAQAKTAAATPAPVKPSEDEKAARLSQAKLAADKLLEAGLLSSAEKRDQFAAEIVDPVVAIQKIAKLAETVSVPRLGRVVVDETQTKVASSDDVWAGHVRSALSRLNLK
jgi:hypothetical protein